MDFKARHVFFSASMWLALCGWRGKENLLNMGFRFQKRIKILPEISVNLGIPQGEALIWKNKRMVGDRPRGTVVKGLFAYCWGLVWLISARLLRYNIPCI